MANYCELEVGIHKREMGDYSVEFRFTQPGSDEEHRNAKPLSARFDFPLLKTLLLDPAEYGRELGRALLGEPEVAKCFAEFRSAAEAQDHPMRLRLYIGPTATDLYELLWETLRTPEDDSCLAQKERVVFSRYLSSYDWRTVPLRPKSELRALIVVANPTDLKQYQLQNIDINAEVARITKSLGEIPVTTLAAPGSATLTTIADKLRDGYDILFLVCHGIIVRYQSWLFLEDDSGATAKTEGIALIQRLRDLPAPPRLVILQSCQTAGEGEESRSAEGGALLALGPQLAEAGIPAVIAMQGRVTVKTAEAFMPVFFRELRRDGQIDRAMAAARSSVRDRHDWWIPVLIMRLRSGRIWYEPGFAGGLDEAREKWPSIVSNIRRGKCVPILGHGLLERYLGSTKDIARRWAEHFNFAMQPHEREDLPQVAQYVAIMQQEDLVKSELEDYLRGVIRERYRDEISDDLYDGPIDVLIEAIGKRRWDQDPLDPYCTLAKLPLTLFVTTTHDNLLEAALRREGKTPKVAICPWNSSITNHSEDCEYVPTKEAPLVYHLFGHIREPESLVLTEDHYFAFLIAVSKLKDLIPTNVINHLLNSSLLFLGFQIEEWNFRVLLQCIMNHEGANRLEQLCQVAVQIAPEEGRILQPVRARTFLNKYFSKINRSNSVIYWGNGEDFLRELGEQLKKDASGGAR